MNRITETENCSIVLSGSKPKFSRPLYRFDRVLTLHAMKLVGHVNKTLIKSEVKQYLADIISGPSFLDNKNLILPSHQIFSGFKCQPTKRFVFDSVS